MIDKLRKNYKLSSVLTKVFYVASFVLANWFRMSSATLYVYGKPNLLLTIFSTLIAALIFVFLLPVLIRWFLRLSRFINVPQNEYPLIALLFFTIYNLVYGGMTFIQLATPLYIVWGNLVAHLLVGTLCFVGFYKVTANLYFNDVTKPYYFKTIAIAYFIVMLFGGVL